MTEHAPDRIWTGIDIPKTIAGVLAAISAAVIGSFLGVAGTLAGAAVASVIGSVGTEIYHRSIDKGRRKLQGTFTTAPAAVGTPPVAASSATTMTMPAPTPSPRNVRWGRVALVAGALFVLAMGTLTVVELISGRSIADATRGGNGDRSTVSSLFSDRSGADKPTPAPSSSTAPDETPTDQPTQQATTEAPTQEPNPGTTTEAPATDAPTTDAPTTGAPTGTSGGGTGNQGGAGSDQQNSGLSRGDTQNPDNGTE
jgi:hypothetical protein